MIEVRHLHVRIGGRNVLEDVGLRLSGREVVGLIGPPEAGKTTLLKALAGLVPVESGQILYRDTPVDLAGDLRAWRRRLGMSFQNDALFDSLTLYENVAFPLRRRRLDELEIRARALARLAEVGLEKAHDKLPGNLSGGMRKRAGLARATVSDPEVGLFDDPVAGLDPLTGGRILDLIVSMTQRLGMATLVITNDLQVLLPICRRVIMLHAGRIIYEGPPEGLQRSPRPEVVQFATGADEGPL
jgi:phospholipid/cholesterol/gamma-HCH transport system ATP-binding protein